MGAADNSMLQSVYSPQLNNSRNISVFLPQSVLQNTIPREVNILIVLDGEYDVTSAFAYQGGFDVAVRDSVVPESILIGIPSNPDIFNADPNYEFAQSRTFELTFAKCNSSLMDCNPATSGYNVDNTGGTDLFLDYITEQIIPTVMKAIGNFTKGEVSISGCSLGGLTSIYAVASRPTEFARGFSLEGDTPFNYGQVADVVTKSYAASGQRPKAIVMMLATSTFSNFTNPTTNATANELELTMRSDQAFQDIGMVPASQSCIIGTEADMPRTQYPWTTYCEAPANTVATFITTNGQHSIITWTTVFSLGLSTLYGANFSAVNGSTRQRPYVQQYMSQGAGSSSSISISIDNDDDNYQAAFIVVLTFLCLQSFGLIMMYAKYLKDKEVQQQAQRALTKAHATTTTNTNPIRETEMVLAAQATTTTTTNPIGEKTEMA